MNFSPRDRPGTLLAIGLSGDRQNPFLVMPLYVGLSHGELFQGGSAFLFQLLAQCLLEVVKHEREQFIAKNVREIVRGKSRRMKSNADYFEIGD